MKPSPDRLALFYLIPILAPFASLQAWDFNTADLTSDSPALFAIERIEQEVGSAKIDFKVVASDPELKPEGFRLEGSANGITIIAIDQAGLLYGGLEFLELLRSGQPYGSLSVLQNPYMQLRGCKFNIPLDARTPSYTDASDAGQQNIPTVWDFKFWQEYIDHMAQSRFNFISLWSLNPFPSIVRTPGYEDVALDDVWRSRTIRKKEDYHLWAIGLVTPDTLKDAEVVLEMAMDEKIAFWRKVMAYGKTRNVDFYFVTWNIFTGGTFGQYGITDSVDNPTTRDYFRKSVTALFETYPDLKGIGLTTGENMHGVPFDQKEDWAFDTYGRGALDFAQAHPEREIRFLHRQHMASPDAILDRFQPLVDQENIDFVFSFKYAKAHVYSATEQYYHQEFVKNLEPTGVKTIWTQRNDDTYFYRWGSPDFVREFINNIPRGVTQGHYLGSDQWIWGRDFLHRDNTFNGQLELAKQQYQWTLWGRLSYDPSMSNERFQNWLAHRYSLPKQEAETLLDAWQHASLIYPAVTGFHWGPVDFRWYIEACQSRPGPAENETGFHDVNRFISLPPHKMANCQSIPDFVDGKPSEARSPFDVANEIEKHASAAEALLPELRKAKNSKLDKVLGDIETVAQLGHYYAWKIRGSTELALFRKTENPERQATAIDHLERAARSWYSYTELSLAQYRNPLWTNRVGYVDFRETYQYVLDDIRIAGGDPETLKLPLNVQAQAEPISRPWENL